MVLGGSILLLVIAVVIGSFLAVYTGITSSLREIAMLLGLGGWPGRLATGHIILWFSAVYYSGQPTGGAMLYGSIILVITGSIAIAFYANNRGFIHTVITHDQPNIIDAHGRSDGGLIPISGTVCLDGGRTTSPAPIDPEPVTSPFSATEAAAFEWAVKRKQWLTRRTTYTTIDSGEAAGVFIVETGTGSVGIVTDEPTILLVDGVGFTGYERRTRQPTSTESAPSAVNRLRSSITDDMRYCETTLEDGDPVTVIGRPTSDGRILSGMNGQPMFLLNAEYDRVKGVVDRYLRWTPHAGVLSIGLAWVYVVVLFG